VRLSGKIQLLDVMILMRQPQCLSRFSHGLSRWRQFAFLEAAGRLQFPKYFLIGIANENHLAGLPSAEEALALK
jgi:hypothetical protein